MINIFSLIIFSFSILQIVFNIAKTLITKDLVDFLVYKQAIDKFFQGKDIYKYLYSYPLDKIPFNYPPSTIMILSFLRLFSTKTGEIIFIILSFVLFILSFYFILKLTKIKISLAHFLIITSLFIKTFPVKFTLILGQVNLIVLGLLLTSLYLYFKYKKNRYLYLLPDFRKTSIFLIN